MEIVNDCKINGMDESGDFLKKQSCQRPDLSEVHDRDRRGGPLLRDRNKETASDHRG